MTKTTQFLEVYQLGTVFFNMRSNYYSMFNETNE
jgi:hypothetical protein